MTFQINGANGKYDGIVADSSIKYGRNSVDNHFKYMEAPIVNDSYNPAPILDFSANPKAGEQNIESLEKFADKNDEYLNSLPPLEFEYRYMPEGNFDKTSAISSAYEEMGQVEEMPIEEFENKFLVDENMTAEPIDINKDGKISNAEYATTIIASDILSKEEGATPDGTINSKGMNAILEYTKIANSEKATQLYSDIYNTYKLGE